MAKIHCTSSEAYQYFAAALEVLAWNELQEGAHHVGLKAVVFSIARKQEHGLSPPIFHTFPLPSWAKFQQLSKIKTNENIEIIGRRGKQTISQYCFHNSPLKAYMINIYRSWNESNQNNLHRL